VVRARRGKVLTGEVGMLGLVGQAHTPLSPHGKVFVHGEFWDATCATPVEPGAQVRVIAIEGLQLIVEPA
jgi:membrane-bound serine protease (ClpP class)